uniref:MLO-like protein n=1 Tax=Cannabis sativa TaxID=3483 RepID=A0A803QJM3_CANSA
MGDNNSGSLEHTPTWAISIFALFFFFVSFAIDGGLHCLNKFLRKRKRKSLNRALEKFKTEMMKMGLISLLLTVSEVPISKICISQTLANSFLPCENPSDESATTAEYDQLSNSKSNNSTTFFTDAISTNENYCDSKGKVSLISRDGVFQLNIFVSVLAVSHVLYCLVTMFLGMAKMRKWKAWESETQTLEYQIANDPRRFQYSDETTFGKRHLKFWSKYPVLLGPVCLVRQFIGSAISKADYFTLRNGFITANFAEGSNFNFQKFLARAYDNDFEQVVGVRLWIWIFSILFIFFSAHVFYNHYWLPFIPLGIALMVGAKLQVIITKMCVETHKENPVIRGSFIVKPNDDLFWFGRPHWLLHLIQFILIQNSFQLAFFTWTWFEYGQKSCFHRETEDLTITISMGVIVQLLCGYVTLPLYALVTQMGSGMKRAVFTESVAKGLRRWLKNARRNAWKNSSTSSPRRSSISLQSDTTDASVSEEQIMYKHIRSRPSYFANPLIQTTSSKASIAAMYLASVVESATTFYKFDFQLTAPPRIVKTRPVKDLLPSGLLRASCTVRSSTLISSSASARAYAMKSR